VETRETPSPIVDRILTGHEHRRIDRCVRRRGTGDWLLIHTLGGEAHFAVPGGDRPVAAGETILYRPGAPQDYLSPRAWSLVWAHFHARPEWHEWLRWPEVAPGMMRMAPPAQPLRGRIEALLIDAHQLAGSGLPHAKDLALNALEAALLWWDIQNPERGQLDARIVAAIEHVARHVATPIKVVDLARVAHLSVSRFSHLFRQQVGLAPRTFVERQRLERAAQLLELTSLPIQAVAAQVGFTSQFHFAHRFHQRLGTTPSAYRAAARDTRTARPRDASQSEARYTRPLA
jgi:AraC family transcriptional regulator of arabinose operon